MIDSIILDQKRVFACSVYLQGEYGHDEIFLGVPAKLGANGMEEIIQINLTDEERRSLHRSADAVRELLSIMKLPAAAGVG
jgi:malate dehydrogenase